MSVSCCFWAQQNYYFISQRQWFRNTICHGGMELFSGFWPGDFAACAPLAIPLHRPLPLPLPYLSLYLPLPHPTSSILGWRHYITKTFSIRQQQFAVNFNHGRIIAATAAIAAIAAARAHNTTKPSKRAFYASRHCNRAPCFISHINSRSSDGEYGSLCCVYCFPISVEGFILSQQWHLWPPEKYRSVWPSSILMTFPFNFFSRFAGSIYQILSIFRKLPF